MALCLTLLLPGCSGSDGPTAPGRVGELPTEEPVGQDPPGDAPGTGEQGAETGELEEAIRLGEGLEELRSPSAPSRPS